MKPVIGITSSLDERYARVRREYIAAVTQSGGLPVVLPVCDCAEELVGTVDGLLVPGGGDLPPDYYGEKVDVAGETLKFEPRERSDFDLAVVGLAIERDVPLLAICYGMQLLNVFHGGTLFQDLASQLDRVHDHSRGFHEVRMVKPLWQGLAEVAMVNSSHHQAVKELGGGLEVFAVADDGIIEGIVRTDRPFCVGVQWHPERIYYGPLSTLIFGRFIEAAAAARRRKT